MLAHPETPDAPWLEIIEGSAPVLLIAPHGGRAGPAASAALHPKVNDLHTAEITRELAARLGATALINAGMDRNTLDCNRLGQLATRAPWLLEMVAQRLEELVARHGRAVALLIHGWNVIEPRIDFGLGLKAGGGVLRAHGAACVSASDAFIHGPLANLAERLREQGIIPTVGLRYPAGGSQNLLQAFTERFRESPIEPLRRLGRLAATGVIDALQLELSVALRWPGSLRRRGVETLADAFSRPTATSRRERAPITIVRSSAKPPSPHPPKRPAAALPARLGMEFFDPAAGIGVMASFDLGHSANGARFILLLDGRRVALFTSEGKPTHDSERIARGPLALRHDGDRIALGFNGPALISPDSIGYLSVEDSLAAGTLQETAEIAISLQPRTASMNLGSLLAALQRPAPILASPAAFGSVSGRIAVDGLIKPVEAIGRIGHSFTTLGNVRFRSRRMLWAYFPSHPTLSAVEAFLLTHRDGTEESCGRWFANTEALACSVKTLELEAPSPEASPSRLAALLVRPNGAESLLTGEVESSLPLSRPGPDLSRVHTSLGFARFRLDGHEGAGMFEYSRCAEPVAAADSASDEND